MAKIWSETYDSARHGNPMGSEAGEPKGLARHHRAPTIDPHNVILVRVAGFTFEFHSLQQLRECLEFYARRHHPSGRSAARADAVASGEVLWRLHVERWYERLPLYLREEPKRTKVVAALESALHRAATGDL